VGFDKGFLDTGLLLLNQHRSEKSPLGNNADLVKAELEDLFPTISMPLSIVLYDLGKPQCIDPNGDNGSDKSNNQEFAEKEIRTEVSENTHPENSTHKTKRTRTLKEVA
jgi:hypothetical protein